MDKSCVPIIGFEDSYHIYPDGRVFSIKKNMYRKPVLINNGYLNVMLKSGGIRKSFQIHRLVAIHFIPNPENKATVNHVDGNKANNDVSNLEWMTLVDNIRHGYASGLLKPPPLKCGADHPRSIFKAKDIDRIRSLRDGGMTYGAIASIYGCHLATIHNISKRKSYTNIQAS